MRQSGIMFAAKGKLAKCRDRRRSKMMRATRTEILGSRTRTGSHRCMPAEGRAPELPKYLILYMFHPDLLNHLRNNPFDSKLASEYLTATRGDIDTHDLIKLLRNGVPLEWGMNPAPRTSYEGIAGRDYGELDVWEKIIFLEHHKTEVEMFIERRFESGPFLRLGKTRSTRRLGQWLVQSDGTLEMMLIHRYPHQSIHLLDGYLSSYFDEIESRQEEGTRKGSVG